MIKYWMTRESKTSQAGPYGEPPLGQVEIYEALLGITKAYRKLGGLDVAWDSELVKAEYVIEHYEDLMEGFYE